MTPLTVWNNALYLHRLIQSRLHDGQFQSRIKNIYVMPSLSKRRRQIYPEPIGRFCWLWSAKLNFLHLFFHMCVKMTCKVPMFKSAFFKLFMAFISGT